MILVAGLSPAWQQIVVLDELQVGEVNRAREVHWCASGKVLNVALAVHRLGLPCRAVSIAGGELGPLLRSDFARQGVPCDWIETTGGTRVCTTILDGRSRVTTELVENAAAISPEDLDRFREAFRAALPEAKFVVFAGSLPAGVPQGLYAELLGEVTVPSMVDVQGPVLELALASRPTIVKPNREELANTLKRPLETGSDLVAAMQEVCSAGPEWVIVSAGGGALWAASKTEAYRVQPPAVPVVNPIGSGDCLAAGVACGLFAGDSFLESLRFGVAAASENVRHLLPAQLDRPVVDELKKQVRVEPVALV